MGGRVLEYDERNMKLTCSFPVLSEQLNPAGQMQGGFIAAAFDNTFGPLSQLTAGLGATTIDMRVDYHRPVKEGDVLLITARVVKKGRNILQMAAEGYDSQGRLVASSASNWLVRNRTDI